MEGQKLTQKQTEEAALMKRQRKEREEDMKSAMLRKPNLRPKFGYSRSRVAQLSKPKCDTMEDNTRPIPIVPWGNQEPLQPLKAATLKANPSKRIEALAVPKKSFVKPELVPYDLYVYSCGRSSPIQKKQGENHQ
ncbi:unnamed protein product [Oikopleura dioica]|uniref:Uncharacterized protein n=1 Tax=Oikopleura dioica TaxID=34765 RepID=E4WX41_OIKDI|nr:unnamed protein product [Oikopleura dioica]